jgi:hypothetical protein
MCCLSIYRKGKFPLKKNDICDTAAAQGIQTKKEELEEVNQALRNRDKMKDDAIAQLSDQVMALTARMQEFERKQQSYY